jgi:thiol-disulfide isomerase/thioredoxin
MPVREISNDSLNGELTSAGDKLVMVDFFATWFVLYLLFPINYSNYNRCGPCKNIAPHIEHLSSQYPNAVFLKADVEKCTVEILF